MMNADSHAPHPDPRRAVRRALVLLNPGRVSRFYLAGLAAGAGQLGIDVRALELGALWSRPDAPRDRIARELLTVLEREKIDLVISYTFNGVFDLAVLKDATGRATSIFGHAGVPHLMLWTDHPHWAHERAALQRPAQAVLRQAHQHHFLKADYAAQEVRRFLGWERVYGLSVGEDPSLVRPAEGVAPEFDIVAVVGSPPYLPEEVAPFLDQASPDTEQIFGAVAGRTARMLDEVWRTRADAFMRDKLARLGRDWVEAKRRDPRRAAFRHFSDLTALHPDAAAHLTEHYEIYFDALHAMWEFGRWQRAFVPLYLSRHFRVGVFGQDWSSVGLPGSAAWVNYDQQSAVYARGRVALNVNQCNDEEGLSHKAFQITAGGAPCLHLDRPGVAEHFEPGREIAAFADPADAREQAAALLGDEARRTDLAQGGLMRFRRDHTWARRLEQMLSRMFDAPPAPATEAVVTLRTVPPPGSTADLERHDGNVVTRVQ
ncbi:MAG: hypothetical protein FLDDKLPJ_01334 [Phycisphaerae bacterium]|nr:hypothetical protein [Phycisphaerae bacterium]